MKIVMLGNTNVGKTTYMASLYGIMQQRIEGFSLKSVNADDGSRLLELAKTISSGSYPFATDQRQDYNFFLQYQGRDVFQFCWSDYRGGAITETQNSDQASALIRDLREADGVMMFCDCDAIARGNVRANELRRMTTLVTQAMRDLNHPISLAIILTKTDKIRQFQEQLFSPFSGLISVINASEWVVGALLPIACGTQFINIPMPLLFALYSAVYMQAAVLAYSIQQHVEAAEEWKKKSQGLEGLFRWVGDVWNGNPTDEEMVQYSLIKASEKNQEFESIKEPVKALSQYIEKLPIINPQNSLQDYVKACAGLQFYQKFASPVSKSYERDPFDYF